MGKKLASTVHVYRRDADGNPIGSAQVFQAGEEPPAWAQKEITNPKAWGEDDSPSVEEQYAERAAAAPPAGGGDVAPPKGGRRATKQEWLAYATQSGVRVGEDTSKEDIVAACEAAGVPVS